MVKRLLLASCAAALAMAPIFASAQGSDGSIDNWTGWRAGVELGMNHNAYNGFDSSSAFMQTLELGYDYQLNDNVVVGGDVYGDWTSNTSHAVHSFPGSNADFGYRGYGVDGLVGFAANNFLPYLKLGYGRVNLSGDLSGGDNGLRYGAGLMWRLDTNSVLLVQLTYQKVNIPGNTGNGDFKNTNLTIGYNWFFNY